MSEWLHDYWRFLTTEKRWWLLPLAGIAATLVVASFALNAWRPSFLYPIF